MTRPYLSDLTEPELKREVADAKSQHAYDRLRAVLLRNPASKPQRWLLSFSLFAASFFQAIPK